MPEFPEIESCHPRYDREQWAMRVHTRNVAISAEQASGLKCRKRTSIAVLTNTVKDDVEPIRHDARDVLTLIVDWSGTELPDHSCVLCSRGPPEFETGHLSERKQCLTDRASGTLDKNALTRTYLGRTVEQLVRCRPAQDQRGRFCRIDPSWDASHAIRSEGTIRYVRTENSHIRYSIADLKTAHSLPELIDFPYDAITQHERGPTMHPRVKVSPDCHVSVFQARGENADSHFIPTGRRHGCVYNLQLIRTAKAFDLNYPVTDFLHSGIFCNGRVGRIKGARRA